MNINAVIIEDEQSNVDILIHFLKTYCPQVTILGNAGAIPSAISLISSTKPDLIFLDVMLEDGTGFDLLDQIRPYIKNLIFITAYDDYALKAFRYSAIDYLLKPIQIDELIEAVKRVETKENEFPFQGKIDALLQQFSAQKSEEETIAISMVDKIEFIHTKDIVFLEADGKYSVFILENGKKLISSKNIGEYEKNLPVNKFCRVHHGYLINTQQISSINKTDGLFCQMKNGAQIPISRRKKEELFAKLKI